MTASRNKSSIAVDAPRARGQRSPLLHADWQYIEKLNIDDYRAADWVLMNAQRADYMKEQQATQVLEMLRASKDAPTFGYLINNYEHCLQTATRLHQDGHDEQTIVMGLLHDIGFIVCPSNHGLFAAELLRPYISEKNVWALEHHEIFQRVHLHEYFERDEPEFINERDRWKDHPFYDWTAEFVERYDIGTIDPGFENLPLEFFEPMVRRVFASSYKDQD